jgi:Amidohydrolase family
VAHCPTVFSRRGILLEDFGRYRAGGVNLGIGTDTFPHNFIEELRTAAILPRVAAGQAHSVTAADIFTAATIGGARALGRDDLGRLTPGKRRSRMVANSAMASRCALGIASWTVRISQYAAVWAGLGASGSTAHELRSLGDALGINFPSFNTCAASGLSLLACEAVGNSPLSAVPSAFASNRPAAIVRQYGEQFRRTPERKKTRRTARPPPLL